MNLSYIRQIENVGEYLETQKLLYSKVIALVDENTLQFCQPLIEYNFDDIIVVSSGEKSKNLKTAEDVWTKLIDSGANKNMLLVNLGGGVVTDLGSFCASLFLRGVDFINIPTTVLGMVDASIGGKNGVNLNSYKNYIGIIKQPKQVIIHHPFLNTLPEKEVLSGFAEMLKHGLIKDKKHFDALIKLKKKDLGNQLNAALLMDSSKLKLDVVIQDVNDNGIRRTLNFGHTIGHGIESVFLGKVSHGEAVAAGMYCATLISYSKQFLSEKEKDTILNCIAKYFEKINFAGKEQHIIDYCKRDKKNKESNILMVCLMKIGEAEFDVSISQQAIMESLSTYLNEY